MSLRKHVQAFSILLTYTVVGFLVTSDFGISWDEPIQREYGAVVYDHVFEDGTALLEHPSRYHGPVLQFGLNTVERLTGRPETAFQLRHHLTFAVTLVGCLFLYLLFLELGFGPHWAMLGMVFLLCSPRLFAHSFYNAKDAVFMHVFVVATYLMLRFIRKPNIGRGLVFGSVTGILIDVRILGLFVPMTFIVLWLLEAIRAPGYLKRSWIPVAILGPVIILTMIGFWPTLWHDPIGELKNALTHMSSFPWDDPVLFSGQFLVPKELPWYYLPKWIFISTPLVISLLAVLGCCIWFFNNGLNVHTKPLPFLWLVPMVVIIAKGATVYDGWRHVFFLYPAILIFSVHGARTVFGRWLRFPWARWVPVGLMVFPLVFMIRNHPHQQVYFNPVFIGKAWKNYEMDYWGLSYKQAFEALCDHQPTGTLNVVVANTPGRFNHLMLPETERSRIRFTAVDSADYFLSNFRFPHEHNAFLNGAGPYQRPIHVIDVAGNPIVGVFRLRPAHPNTSSSTL